MAIRTPCSTTKRKGTLWANTKSTTNLPKQQLTCQALLRGRGLPHQCAHWFAMTDLVGVCEFARTAASLPGSSAGTRIATPVCALVRNDRLGRCVRICPNSSQLARLLCGENGLPRQCAHWLAMTCRRQKRVCGCKDAVTCRRKMRVSGCKALGRDDTSPTVIARSEATWQSVLLAVPQNEKEHFGQIRKARRICPKYY